MTTKQKHEQPYKRPKLSESELNERVYAVEKFMYDISKTFSLMGIPMVKLDQSDVPPGKRVMGAFDPETGVLYYDPVMLAERGGSYGETLFVVMHEIKAHFEELSLDPVAYMAEYHRTRGEGKEHLQLLNNILEDIDGNGKVVKQMPALQSTVRTLYETELFTSTDYTDLPRCTQFAYAILRERMVYEVDKNNREERVRVDVDAEVREVIDKLENFTAASGQIVDAIDYLTGREHVLGRGKKLSVRDKIKLRKQIIEEEYLKLYRKDLEDPRQETNSDGQSGSGAGKGQGKAPPQSSEETENKTPEPLTPEEKRQAREQAHKRITESFKPFHEAHHKFEILPHGDIGKIREKIVASGGIPKKDIAPTQEDIKEAMQKAKALDLGVTQTELKEYETNYQKKHQESIKQLAEMFAEIISHRIEYKRALSKRLKREGSILADPTTAYAGSMAGKQPYAFRDIEKRAKESVGIDHFDFTLVLDFSSSMDANKLAMQKDVTLLLLEAFAIFKQQIVDAESDTGLDLEFTARCEVRAFYDGRDIELRKLEESKQGDGATREIIALSKKLSDASGGTPDHLSLGAINKQLDGQPEILERIREKRWRKVVVVLTDGGSDKRDLVAAELQKLKQKGVIVIGLGMTESGRPVEANYGAQGVEAKTIVIINELKDVMQEIIERHVADIG